jgi:hypothetical protein
VFDDAAPEGFRLVLVCVLETRPVGRRCKTHTSAMQSTAGLLWVVREYDQVQGDDAATIGFRLRSTSGLSAPVPTAPVCLVDMALVSGAVGAVSALYALDAESKQAVAELVEEGRASAGGGGGGGGGGQQPPTKRRRGGGGGAASGARGARRGRANDDVWDEGAGDEDDDQEMTSASSAASASLPAGAQVTARAVEWGEIFARAAFTTGTSAGPTWESGRVSGMHLGHVDGDASKGRFLWSGTEIAALPYRLVMACV